MQPPPTLDEQMAGAPSPLGLPPGMLASAPQPLGPPPAQMPAAAPLQLPPGMLDQPQASALLQAPPGMAPAPVQAPAQVPPMASDQPASPARDVLAGIDVNDPIALATKQAEVTRDVMRANLAESKRLDVAVKEEADKQERRLAERAEREERARQRVAQQNSEIQAALRSGPQGTWRDVARTGTEALFAILGAAFDRSGLLQQALPQTLNGIVQQGQERVQGAFARQLQALQVGREQAGDELDAAMDDERRIEAAGAAARTALIEESMRQMNLSVLQGKVDQATLDAAGLPAQMQAMLSDAQAKQLALQQEEQRKAEKEALAAAKTKEEIAASQANRARQWAALDLDRDRLALDRERSKAQQEQDRLDTEKKKLEIAKEQGLINDREVSRSVPVTGGRVLLANSPEQARDFAKQYAAAEQISTVLDAMAVKLEQGDASWWSSEEGQKLAADYTQALTLMKDSKEFGALAGPDLDIIQGAIGKDPNDVSWQSLKSQAPRLRQTRDLIEREVNGRARSISNKWAESSEQLQLPRFEAPKAASRSATEAQQALTLKPGEATGTIPKLSDKDVDSYVTQLRADLDRKQSAGELRDRVTGQPLGKEGVVIEQAYTLVDTIKANQRTAAELDREVQRLKRPGLPAGEIARMGQLVQARRNLEATNARIMVALERERTFLRDRAKRSDARVEDKAALEAVEKLIGQYGKQSKGREALKGGR